MQTILDDQEVLVRGTAPYKSYLWFKHGWIKAIVNYAEEYLSITGRLMLLSYIIYIAVQAGMENFLHLRTPPLLDIVMLAIQVAGLEGSIPGLIHTAEDLEERGKTESAKTVRKSARNAQYLAIMTIVDLFCMAVNNAVGAASGIDHRVVITVAIITFLYSWFLLGCRVYVIGNYLISMAHITRHDIRVVSQAEASTHQNTPAQTPDLTQVLADQRAEILAEMQEVLSQLRTEIVAQIPVEKAPDHAAIATHIQPTLQTSFEHFASSLQEQMIALVPPAPPVFDQNAFRSSLIEEVSLLVANHTHDIDYAELASQLAPMVRACNIDETVAVSPDEIDCETVQPRITVNLDETPVKQSRNTDELKTATKMERKSSTVGNDAATKMKRIVKRYPSIGPTKLARETGVSKSTASRFLKSQIDS